MTEIEELLTTGRSMRSDNDLIPTDEEMREAEAALSFSFPYSYREFVRLGGLGELRIRHRVLQPADILASCRFLPDNTHVPFADNGCGDLYCWLCSGDAEPPVALADHETGTYTSTAASFTQWLKENRF